MSKKPTVFLASRDAAYSIGPFILQWSRDDNRYGLYVPERDVDRIQSSAALTFSVERDFTYTDLCVLRETFGSDLINIDPGEPGYYGDYTHASVHLTCSWAKVLPLLHTEEETATIFKEEAQAKKVHAKRKAFLAAKAAGLKVEDPDGEEPEKPFDPSSYPAPPFKGDR